MLFTYPGKASETALRALDVSNNSVMEIKRLCKPTSPEMVSAPSFPLFPGKFQHSRGPDKPVKGNSEVGGGGAESSGLHEDSIMLAVKRLIRIEFSIDVKVPFAPAAGILITGFLLRGII